LYDPGTAENDKSLLVRKRVLIGVGGGPEAAVVFVRKLLGSRVLDLVTVTDREWHVQLPGHIIGVVHGADGLCPLFPKAGQENSQ
jgi:hypothetical protein